MYQAQSISSDTGYVVMRPIAGVQDLEGYERESGSSVFDDVESTRNFTSLNNSATPISTYTPFKY